MEARQKKNLWRALQCVITTKEGLFWQWCTPSPMCSICIEFSESPSIFFFALGLIEYGLRTTRLSCKQRLHHYSLCVVRDSYKKLPGKFWWLLTGSNYYCFFMLEHIESAVQCGVWQQTTFTIPNPPRNCLCYVDFLVFKDVCLSVKWSGVRS